MAAMLVTQSIQGKCIFLDLLKQIFFFMLKLDFKKVWSLAEVVDLFFEIKFSKNNLNQLFDCKI